jgi:hypothetical protein
MVPVFGDPSPCPCKDSLATLAGGDANGDWKLWVFDDATGDSGSMAGWTLELTTNAAPVAGDGSFSGPRDVLLRDTLAGLASDVDDDELDFEAATEPDHGTLLVSSNGTFNYTPADGFVGDDTFTYRVDDGLTSDEGEVTVTVTDGDDRGGPEANPTVSPEPGDSGWHDGDVTVEWNWTDDDADIDPDNCTTQTTSQGQGVQVLTGTCADGAGNETIAEHTVKVDTSTPTIRIGSPAVDLLYVPGADYAIADYSCRDELSGIDSCTGTVADGAPLDTSTTGFHQFVVTARDKLGHEEYAEVWYLVDTPPRAGDGSFSGPRDTDLRASVAGLASDADNDPLHFTVFEPPTHGTLALQRDGTFRYRPDPGYVGIDTFTYQVDDGWLWSRRAEVTITITDIADPGDPTVTITSPTAGRYLQGAVVTADYACADTDSGIATCTGTVADGARIDTSRPGTHSFTVTARDRAGNDHTATVAYTVFVPPTCNGKPATIVGTDGVDVITGTPRDDVIVTGAGRDWITAGAGHDTINAGPARDILLGGTGNDTLHGATGGDTLNGARGNDTLNGGRHTDSCRGGTGTDRATTCERTLGLP